MALRCARKWLCVCVSAGCGWLIVHLGDDDDEGGAVGASLYPIVNHSRVVRELYVACRGWFVSLGSCGADAQLYFKRQRRENGFNEQRLAC